MGTGISETRRINTDPARGFGKGTVNFFLCKCKCLSVFSFTIEASHSLLPFSLLCFHWILRVKVGRSLWGGYYNWCQHPKVGNFFSGANSWAFLWSIPYGILKKNNKNQKQKCLPKILIYSQSENPHFRGTVHPKSHEGKGNGYLLIFVYPFCSWHIEATQSIFVYKFTHRNTLCNLFSSQFQRLVLCKSLSK